MAGAKDKREKGEELKAQQAASDRQAESTENSQQLDRTLLDTQASITEQNKLLGQANKVAAQTVAGMKAQQVGNQALIAAQATASIAQQDFGKKGFGASESAKLIQAELQSITASMKNASVGDLKILKARAEHVQSMAKNVTEEDRAAVDQMVNVTMGAVENMETNLPTAMEKSLGSIGKSVTGILDKSIGRNLINKGLKLFGRTSLDQRKELKKKQKELAEKQLQALANDIEAQKQERAGEAGSVPVFDKAGGDAGVGPSPTPPAAVVEGGQKETLEYTPPAAVVEGGQKETLEYTPTTAAGEGGQKETLEYTPTTAAGEEATVWQQLAAEGIEEGNELLRDGLGIRSPGYLHDMIEFFSGDKLDKVQDRREEKKRSDEQLAALEALEGDGQGGTVAVEAKGAKGGGLFGAIAGGFKGLLNMLKSVGTFIKDLIVGIFDMVAKIMTAIGEGIGGLLKGIAKGLNAFKKESIIGAAAMVIVAAAMWVMAKALQQFSKGVSWKGVAIGLVSMAALAIVTKLMTGSIAGAAAMIIIAGAMWVLGKAMVMFNTINWKAVAVALVTITALGLVAVGLGAIAPLALIGAAAMLVIGAAMYVVASALKVVAEAMNIAIPFFETIGDLITGVIGAIGDFIEGIIGKIVDSLLRIGQLDAGALAAVGGSIGIISGALVKLGASLAGGGLMASVGEFFSWLSGAESPVEVLEKLAAIGPDLALAAESITGVVNGLGEVAKLGKMDISDTLGQGIEDLNDAIDELDENMVDRKIKKLGELAGAMSGEKVEEKGGGFFSSAFNAVANVGDAVANAFDPAAAKERMAQIQREIRNKEMNTASVTPHYERDVAEVARYDRKGGPKGSMQRFEYKDAKSDVSFLGNQIDKNNSEVNELTAELIGLQQLLRENADLKMAASAGNTTSVVSAPNTTYVDNSGDTFVAPESSSNVNAMPTQGGDIDAI